MWGGVAICAAAYVVAATHEREAFEQSIAGLPSEAQERKREERRLAQEAQLAEATAERRHREMVEAARPRGISAVGAGLLGFIFGMGMGG